MLLFPRWTVAVQKDRHGHRLLKKMFWTLMWPILQCAGCHWCVPVANTGGTVACVLICEMLPNQQRTMVYPGGVGLVGVQCAEEPAMPLRSPAYWLQIFANCRCVSSLRITGAWVWLYPLLHQPFEFGNGQGLSGALAFWL